MEIRPCTTSQWLAASSCGVSIFHSPLLHFPNMHYHYSTHTGCGFNPLLLKLVNLTHLTEGECFLPDASCTKIRKQSHNGVNASPPLSTPLYCQLLMKSQFRLQVSHSLWLPILNIHLQLILQTLQHQSLPQCQGETGILLLKKDLTDGKQIKDQVI